MHQSVLAITLALIMTFGSAAQNMHTLTILHLNDTHSNLLPGGPRTPSLEGEIGGIARAATVILQERAKDLPLLTLHAGDAFIGDPMYNLLYDRPPDLELLAQLGLDAMTVGNHEFDLTPAGLLLALTNTLGTPPAFPLLSANLDMSANDPVVQALTSYIQPYVVKQFGGFKVGIFGLTTPTTNYFSQPAPIRVIEDASVLMPLIYAQVQTLLDVQGCDVIVCLSHMGLELDKLIAASIPGIDVIIGSHDHIALKCPVVIRSPLGKDVHIVQTEGFYRQIGKLTLSIDNGKVEVSDYELIELNRKIPENTFIKGVVSGIAGQLEQVFPGLFSQPIAQCHGVLTEIASGLTQPGPHDTHVGNLAADAFRTLTGADIGIQPGGSTAQTFYNGPILPVDVFRVVGYGFNTTNGLGFRVVTFELSGAALLAGIEATLASIDENDEMFLQVSSSLAYYYDPAASVGSRLKYVQYNGRALDLTRMYTIATNELVPEFLDMLSIPYHNLQYLPNDETEFQLLMEYVIAQQNVRPSRAGGRIMALASNAMNTPPRNTAPASLIRSGVNPFVDNTSVTISLDSPTVLSIAVYDVLGREVLRIADGEYYAGKHTLSLNAQKLHPGTYFCMLRCADGRTSTVRLLKTR